MAAVMAMKFGRVWHKPSCRMLQLPRAAGLMLNAARAGIAASPTALRKQHAMNPTVQAGCPAASWPCGSV